MKDSLNKWTTEFYDEEEKIDNEEDDDFSTDNGEGEVDTHNEQDLKLYAEKKKFEVWKILRDHLKEQLKNECTNAEERINRLKHQTTTMYRVTLDEDQLDKFEPKKTKFKCVLLLFNKS